MTKKYTNTNKFQKLADMIGRKINWQHARETIFENQSTSDIWRRSELAQSTFNRLFHGGKLTQYTYDKLVNAIGEETHANYVVAPDKAMERYNRIHRPMSDDRIKQMNDIGFDMSVSHRFPTIDNSPKYINVIYAINANTIDDDDYDDALHDFDDEIESSRRLSETMQKFRDRRNPKRIEHVQPTPEPFDFELYKKLKSQYDAIIASLRTKQNDLKHQLIIVENEFQIMWVTP